jgi:hypothetical protein
VISLNLTVGRWTVLDVRLLARAQEGDRDADAGPDMSCADSMPVMSCHRPVGFHAELSPAVRVDDDQHSAASRR